MPYKRQVKTHKPRIYVICKEEKNIALYTDGSNTFKLISGNQVPTLSLNNKPMEVHWKLKTKSH